MFNSLLAEVDFRAGFAPDYVHRHFVGQLLGDPQYEEGILLRYFLAWWMRVFSGGFEGNGCFDVVFWW
jgi:hypothetical protein